MRGYGSKVTTKYDNIIWLLLTKGLGSMNFISVLWFYRTKSTGFRAILCHESKIWVVIEAIVVLFTVSFAFPVLTTTRILLVLTMGAGIFSTNSLTRVCHTKNITFSSFTQTIGITECSIRTSHIKIPFTSDFSKQMLNITIPSYMQNKIIWNWDEQWGRNEIFLGSTYLMKYFENYKISAKNISTIQNFKGAMWLRLSLVPP